MSEVIVRMEMPISCAVCRCHADGWCYLLSIQPSECTYDSRPSWCPIVGELPELHGDLIDRDVALNDVERFVCYRCRLRKNDDCLWCTAYAVKGVLIEVEPIIADAERSET